MSEVDKKTLTCIGVTEDPEEDDQLAIVFICPKGVLYAWYPNMAPFYFPEVTTPVDHLGALILGKRLLIEPWPIRDEEDPLSAPLYQNALRLAEAWENNKKG